MRVWCSGDNGGADQTTIPKGWLYDDDRAASDAKVKGDTASGSRELDEFLGM